MGMNVMADNPEDGHEQHDKPVSLPSVNKELEVYSPDFGEEPERHFDRTGKILPLTPREQEILSGLDVPYELFPALEEFRHGSQELIEIVQGMCAVSKSDDERQEDDDSLATVTEEVCENFVLTLRETQEFSGTQDDFLMFAIGFTHKETNERAKKLQDLFNDDDAFPQLTLKRTTKRVLKYVSFANSDEDIPAHIGDYYANLLMQDMNMVQKFMKEVYRDQDLHDLKGYMLRMCEMLDKLNGAKTEETEQES